MMIHTVYVQISKGCNVCSFYGQGVINKFSSLKFHRQNFGLHQLENRIHLNGYNRHLKD